MALESEPKAVLDEPKGSKVEPNGALDAPKYRERNFFQLAMTFATTTLWEYHLL